MRRRNSTRQVRIYTFGLHVKDAALRDALRRQLYLSNRLWNALVRLYRRPLPRWPEKGSDEYTAWRAATAALEARYKELVPVGIGPRQRVPFRDQAVADVLADADAPAEWKRFIKAERRRLSHRKRLYRFLCDKGLAAATYELTLKAFDDAVAAARKGIREFPSRHRFRGEGRVGFTFQNLGEIWRQTHSRNGTSRVFRVMPARIARTRYELSVLQHRPLPPDAIVKQAWVLVRIRGRRPTYQLQLVVESDLFAREQRQPGACGVAFCWNRMPDGGMLVAVAHGDDGVDTPLCLPPKLIGQTESQLSQVRALAADGAFLFGEVKDMAGALGEFKPRGRLTRASLYHAVMRSIRTRGPTLDWPTWKAEMLAAERDLFDDTLPPMPRLECWARKDAHLFEWERNLHAKACAHRDECYRVWAAKLRRRYATITVEDAEEKGVRREHFQAAIDKLKQWLAPQMRVLPLDQGEPVQKRAQSALARSADVTQWRTSRKAPAKAVKKEARSAVGDNTSTEV